ncbi:MAG: O-antigen ligase family protein [Ignavibacteriae bacterium]|nr:O-antigen ligase family protein [Ignavibacteriota bacterium]
MEIILLFGAIIVLALFLFILIEQPYYLVSVFVFMYLYGFNFELPGPLDLRGFLSLILFLRIIIFDNNNLNLIRQNISNKFIVIILFFTLYVIINQYFNGGTLFKILRIQILNLVAFFIGFTTVLNGKYKQTILFAILISGLFSTIDLIYSYFLRSSLFIYKVIEYNFLTPVKYNHNFFGEICGEAIITAFVLIVFKSKNKLVMLFLLSFFLLGLIISTSRMSFVSSLVTILIIIVTQKSLKLNLKKIFISGFLGILLLTIVAITYSFVLKEMNIKSTFSKQLYYRLVEEPVSIFDEDKVIFGWNENIKKGSMKWRFEKFFTDMTKFFKQNTSKVLFGFGIGGYSKIGEITYTGGKDAFQYSAHNFYTNTIAEIGLIGLLFFIFFFILLIINILKLVRENSIPIPLVYILIYMFIYTLGGDPNLLEKYAFLLYGGVIAEYLIGKNEEVKNYHHEDNN